MKEKLAHTRPSAPRCLCRSLLACVPTFLFVGLVPVRIEPVDPPLPQLLEKLHDLYLDQYALFAKAFSAAVELPSKTPYGRELKSDIHLCKLYQNEIVDYSARLLRQVAPISADRAEQKKTVNELIWLNEQLAEANRIQAEVLLNLSLETGLDWREQFEKLQSDSVSYQMLLAPRIQQLISSTF